MNLIQVLKSLWWNSLEVSSDHICFYSRHWLRNNDIGLGPHSGPLVSLTRLVVTIHVISRWAELGWVLCTCQHRERSVRSMCSWHTWKKNEQNWNGLSCCAIASLNLHYVYFVLLHRESGVAYTVHILSFTSKETEERFGWIRMMGTSLQRASSLILPVF